ncbi:uncharacterized protein TNCV_4097991 [Trichonephila clavipes]|nr:uncharacterized protein TNCV_4097991 [Trichonephila clavipes]
MDNVERSQISGVALRALALNSREQFIQEQREDPELGHIYRFFEYPDDGSVNATVCKEENHDNCYRFLHEFSFALRTSVNETTGKTPVELFFGRKIITPFRKLVKVTDGAEYVGGNIEKLFDEARQNMQRQHKTWEKYYNRKKREVNIKVNDLVLVQFHFISAVGKKVVGKFIPKFEGPYRVLEVRNNNMTIWKRGRRVTVNIDQVWSYHLLRHSDTNSFDSINETLYEGKGSSNWSNRSNSGKSRCSRKPSGNERKSCKSNKGIVGLEDLRLKRTRAVVSTGTAESTSDQLQMRRFSSPKEESRRGARVQSGRARETRTTGSEGHSAAEGRPVRSRKTILPVLPKQPLQAARRTTRGAEYWDRQSTTEQPQEKEH